MYAKIENNCIREVSSTEKEGFTHIAVNYDAFIKNRSNGLYKTCPFGILLKDNLPIMVNPSNRKTKKQETKKVNTQEERLKVIKEQFEKAVDMNVLYKNGQYYKPRYASESYQPLISAEIALQVSTQGQQTLFPKEIWDATKTHSAMMTLQQLEELALYLAKIYEVQFQQYKQACAKILGEE